MRHSRKHMSSFRLSTGTQKHTQSVASQHPIEDRKPMADMAVAPTQIGLRTLRLARDALITLCSFTACTIGRGRNDAIAQSTGTADAQREKG